MKTAGVNGQHLQLELHTKLNYSLVAPFLLTVASFFAPPFLFGVGRLASCFLSVTLRVALSNETIVDIRLRHKSGAALGESV